MRHICAVLTSLAAALLFALPPQHKTVEAAPGSPGTRNDPRQALAIIVNRSNPIENLSLTDLRKIFLGERSRWPNGHRVTVTMMESGYAERDAVLRDIYRMTESGYRNHFLKGTYTGDIPVSPKTLSSPQILRKFIFNAPGAIGYLRASDVDATVKVIRIDGRFPSDLDYKLQIEGPAK